MNCVISMSKKDLLALNINLTDAPHWLLMMLAFRDAADSASTSGLYGSLFTFLFIIIISNIDKCIAYIQFYGSVVPISLLNVNRMQINSLLIRARRLNIAGHIHLRELEERPTSVVMTWEPVSHHQHFWPTTLRVHSTTCSQQLSERVILSHIDCFSQCEIVGLKII